MILPEPIRKLINAFERLPGIGPKSASRLAFYLLRAPDEVSQDLSEALNGLKDKIAFCEECFNITEAGRTRCEVCENLKTRWLTDLCRRRGAGCFGDGTYRRI